MEPFKYVKASSNQNAISAMLGADTKFIAGGTNLIDLMRLNIEKPHQLVDVKALPYQSIETLPMAISA